jgi:CRP-like cAMP-binding protein
MIEELPAPIEDIIRAIVEEQCLLREEGTAPLPEIIRLANENRPGTTREAVLRVLHRFKIEGFVSQSGAESYYLLPYTEEAI